MGVTTYILYGVSLSNKELVERVFGDFRLKNDAFDAHICQSMAHRLVRKVNHVDFRYFRAEDINDDDPYINIFGTVIYVFDIKYSSKADMRLLQIHKAQFNRLMEAANITCLINKGRYIVFTVSNSDFSSFMVSPRSIILQSKPVSPEINYCIPRPHSRSHSPLKAKKQ